MLAAEVSFRFFLAISQWLSDLPMVAKGINDASNAPAIALIRDRPDYRGSGGDGPVEDGVRILDGQHHPRRTTAEGLRTEVEMLRRLVGEPELGPVHCHPSNHLSFVVFDAKQLLGSKCSLVKVNCTGAASNREQG